MGIDYVVDPSIVRGLDYYTGTVFEFIAEGIGAQSTVCGGGRYDGLVSSLGGPELQGIGFGMGITRLILAMRARGVDKVAEPAPKVYIASMGEAATVKALEITERLRKGGIFAECDVVGRSLKAQMKYANKISAEYTLIIGDSEIESGRAQLRNMSNGEQTEVELADFRIWCGTDPFGIGLDPRIGTKYLSSGVGFGGPALPQDTKVLQHLAKENNVELSLVDAAVKVNDNRSAVLLKKIKSIVGSCQGKKFAVLGLAYKGNTDDIRESPAFKVIDELLREDAKVVAYDSNSTTAFRKKMKSDQHLVYANTLEEALRTCDYAVFLNESEEFKKLTNDEIVDYMKVPVVFDGKAVLNPYQLPGVTYYAIGKKNK